MTAHAVHAVHVMSLQLQSTQTALQRRCARSSRETLCSQTRQSSCWMPHESQSAGLTKLGTKPEGGLRIFGHFSEPSEACGSTCFSLVCAGAALPCLYLPAVFVVFGVVVLFALCRLPTVSALFTLCSVVLPGRVFILLRLVIFHMLTWALHCAARDGRRHALNIVVVESLRPQSQIRRLYKPLHLAILFQGKSIFTNTFIWSLNRKSARFICPFALRHSQPKDISAPTPSSKAWVRSQSRRIYISLRLRHQTLNPSQAAQLQQCEWFQPSGGATLHQSFRTTEWASSYAVSPVSERQNSPINPC